MTLLRLIQSHWRSIAFILFVVLFSRFFIYGIGYIGINLFAYFDHRPEYITVWQADVWKSETMRLPDWVRDTTKLLVNDTEKFDALNYLKIASEGYDRYAIDEPHPPANWVFYPLYPLLLAGFAKLLPMWSMTTSAIALSTGLFPAAAAILYAIARKLGLGVAEARFALMLLAVYPTSMYFSFPYTESLFLLLSAACVLLALRGQYALALIAAGLAMVTRVPGVINYFFVLGCIVLEHRRLPEWRLLIRYAATGLLSVVPYGLYLLHMHVLTGDFLAPFHEQSLNWYRETTVPFLNLYRYLQNPYFNGSGGWDNGVISFSFSIVFLLLYVAYVGFQWKRLWADKRELLLFVYGFFLIALPFASSEHSLTSVVRYMMVAFPFYLYAARLSANREWLRYGLLTVFAGMNVLYTIGFFNNYYFVV